VRRAFRSELVKLRRWSVLAGVPALVFAAVALPYLAVGLVTNPATAKESRFHQVLEVLPTARGLITLISFPQLFIEAIAITMVTANLAAEWSQGTIRNLLVREPGRLRLLAGKMLALLLFVAATATLALFVSAGFTLLDAEFHGLSTTPWVSSRGVSTLVTYWGSEVLGLIGIGLLGMPIAVITRSVATAVGVSLAYVLIAEDLITVVWPGGAVWFPHHLFSYLWGTPSPFTPGAPPMGYTSDAIGVLFYALGFISISAIAFRRMDIIA
jgi:ABC-2 type transport system permease protein